MIVHVIYDCPRCGCQSFRRSMTRMRKDPLLHLVGIDPYRCHICRIRFYLFQPAVLRAIVSEPDHSTAPSLKPLESPPLPTWDTEVY